MVVQNLPFYVKILVPCFLDVFSFLFTYIRFQYESFHVSFMDFITLLIKAAVNRESTPEVP